MAAEFEEVLAMWRDAERVLDALPDEAPERPIILIQVARLRRYYARLTNDAAPASWQLLESTHEAIAETRRILGDARARVRASGTPESSLSATDRLMEGWLLAEQELNRAGEDPLRRSELLRAADDARDRYQAALDQLEPDLAD
ncbi:MAG TPA: hypothetical protein VFV72_14690 [Candidatus Limnocylindrales bacterium]|nr:hypothetical protein [Candidatus Limnocylindrales bacterium]